MCAGQITVPVKGINEGCKRVDEERLYVAITSKTLFSPYSGCRPILNQSRGQLKASSLCGRV